MLSGEGFSLRSPMRGRAMVAQLRLGSTGTATCAGSRWGAVGLAWSRTVARRWLMAGRLCCLGRPCFHCRLRFHWQIHWQIRPELFSWKRFVAVMVVGCLVRVPSPAPAGAVPLDTDCGSCVPSVPTGSRRLRRSPRSRQPPRESGRQGPVGLLGPVRRIAEMVEQRRRRTGQPRYVGAGGEVGDESRTSLSMRWRRSLNVRQAQPAWRATCGSLSGPSRMTATTAMMTAWRGRD